VAVWIWIFKPLLTRTFIFVAGLALKHIEQVFHHGILVHRLQKLAFFIEDVG
jgi:hypothetical protein